MAGASLGGRTAEIALARLALAHGADVSRDELAAALWDEAPPQSWRAVLRNAVTRLRGALDAAGFGEVAALEATGDGYRLRLPDDLAVDIETLGPTAVAAESAAARGDHTAAHEIASTALSTSGQTVLAGRYGDWVDSLRTDVSRRRERLARIAGEAALAVGDHAEAERTARELVHDLPLREDGYRLLMRALNAAGNSAEALAVYDECRRRLADELAAVPSAATQTLFLGILREEPTSSPRVTPGTGRLLLVHRQTPFVGRADLLDHMAAALDEARADGPRVVTIGGEPGLGKTRLAAALAAAAHDAGVTTVYGRADDRIAIPYGPFLEAIDGYFAGLDAAEAAALLGRHSGILSRLVPSIAAMAASAEPTDSPDLNQLHLAVALEHALRAVAGTSGALLILDDMQWASRAALALVEQLAASAPPAPLLVVVMHRGSEVPQKRRVESIELEPLTVADITALARLQGGNDEAAARVWRDSGGNALLASELLSRPGGDGEHPARIDELVRERLARLPAGAADVLRTAAVAGLEFDPAIVAVASGTEAGAAAEALERAREVRLLVDAIERPGWLAFRHALVRASLLDTVGADAEKEMHQRLGVALENEPWAGASHASLAYHFGAAAPLGGWRAAVRYGLPVARAAFDDGMHEDAVAVAGRTLVALEAAGDPDPLARLDLQILRGTAQRALGDVVGHETLGVAFAGAAARGDATRMADAALGYTHGGAATEEAFVDDLVLPMYEQALEAIGTTDDARRARLLGRIATGYAWQRSGERARAPRDEAYAIATRLADEATLGHVVTSVRRSLTGTASVDEQYALETTLIDLAVRHDDARGRARALLWRFDTSVASGDGDGLEDLLDEAGAIIATLPDASYHHSLGYSRGALAFIRGDIEAADREVERAAAVGRERGVPDAIVEAVRLGHLMGVRYEQGRLAELRDEIVPFFAASGMPAMRGTIAWVDALLGNTDGVADHLQAFLDDVAVGGVRFITGVAGLPVIGEPILLLGDAELARQGYEILRPYPRRAGLVSQQGSTDFTLGQLARMLGREDDAQRHLADGAAFAERLGAPLWKARCLEVATA